MTFSLAQKTPIYKREFRSEHPLYNHRFIAPELFLAVSGLRKTKLSLFINNLEPYTVCKLLNLPTLTGIDGLGEEKANRNE